MRAHRDRYRKFWRMAEGAVDCAMLGLPIEHGVRLARPPRRDLTERRANVHAAPAARC